MLDQLPSLIDPISFSEKKKVLSGSFQINELSRLSEMLYDKVGEIKVDIEFKKEGRVSVIQGSVKGTLNLICQNCLESIDWDTDIDFKLGVVSSIEQADNLAGDCEPLLLEEQKVSLIELVEDELLLSMPDFPKHDHTCQESTKQQEAEQDEERVSANNPFSVLANLKNTGD